MCDKENRRTCFKCGASPLTDGVTLFRVLKPGTRNQVRCELWAKYLYPDRNVSSIEFQMKLFNEHKMLCSDHFKDEDFRDGSRKYLLRTAVPCDRDITEDRSTQIINDRPYTDSDRSAGPSHQGHRLVCLICGGSLASRQSHHILAQNRADRVIEIIQNRIAPRQISPDARSCHACWMQCTRTVIRNEQVNAARNVEEAIPDHPPSSSEEEEPRPIVQVNVAGHPSTSVPNTITLPNYRRGPNTESHCLFYGCDRLSNLHVISNTLRITILVNYNYYIPKLARVCSEHLSQNSWDILYNAENSINTFTTEQVEDIFSFVSLPKQFLDFSSIQNVQLIDEDLFKYWVGMTKNDFLSLLNDVPRITEKKLLGLAGILIKMRTGDSNVRISSILKVPRSTLESLMSEVVLAGLCAKKQDGK